MGKLTIDDATGRRLAAATGLIELCDSGGNRIGYFSPVHPSHREPSITEAELQERERETELYSYEEVKAHLRSL